MHSHSVAAAGVVRRVLSLDFGPAELASLDCCSAVVLPAHSSGGEILGPKKSTIKTEDSSKK